MPTVIQKKVAHQLSESACQARELCATSPSQPGSTTVGIGPVERGGVA